MSYTKMHFAQNLKKMVRERQGMSLIGKWIYKIYVDWPDTQDVAFLELLLHLNTIELGSEFVFSYDELDKIADDLIAGKDVRL